MARIDKMKLKAKGIMLDLDGTIVDSREAYKEAARIAFLTLGQKAPNPQTFLEIPRRLEQSKPVADIISGNVTNFLDVYLKTFYSITKKKTKPLPNVQVALRNLSQQAKLALITMRFVPKLQIIRELEQFSLESYFKYIVTALEIHKPKPSPEALIKIVRALDVDICDCVIVGDSVIDVRAGKAAGTKTVAVLSGLFSYDELSSEQPDLILDNVTKLPDYVDSAS